MKDASFAIIIKEGSLLLTQRLDVPLWVLPGGGIESQESPEAAAIREVKEETGVDIRIVRKTHEMTPLNRLALPTHLFLAEPLSPPQTFSPETKENRYFPLTKLPKELFWPHRLWIEEALKSEHLIRRPLSEISYKAALAYFLLHPWQVVRYLMTRFTKD